MFDVNKILGTKKSTKLTELSMSKVFGKNPISDMIGGITKKPLHNLGASPKMQNKWKSFSIQKRNIIRKTHKDSDGDRIPNIFDCSPFNVMKQDNYVEPSHKYRKQMQSYLKKAKDVDMGTEEYEKYTSQRASSKLKFDEKSKLITSDDEKNLYGYINAYPNTQTKSIVISDIFIHPDRRGEGHAHKALDHLWKKYPESSSMVGQSTQPAVSFWKNKGAEMSGINMAGNEPFFIDKKDFGNTINKDKIKMSDKEKLNLMFDR